MAAVSIRIIRGLSGRLLSCQSGKVPFRAMGFVKLPEVTLSCDAKSKDFDSVVVVGPSVEKVSNATLKSALQTITKLDKSADDGVFLAPCDDIPAKRVIYSSTGKLDKDIDDVRRFEDAVEKGIKKSLAAGSKNPLLVLQEAGKFKNGELVSLLAAYKTLYVPIEMREDVPSKAVKLENFGFASGDEKVLDLAKAIEAGRYVARDIGGSDPERMAAPKVLEYVQTVFKGTDIKIEVVKGQDVLEKEYPCFAAVNRCASGVERHDGCVIWLTYEPKGNVEETLMLVGKGVTYDTGGADIKAGGIMAGMSRDKCGAAACAGFMETVAQLKPKKTKVVAAMCMVRNSVGSNCYVSDEIITARSGVRLRVGNTDAEGRMAMVDVLCHMKEKALKEKNPHLMTFATLTGHAVLANGYYTAIVDNGPARKQGFARAMFDTGEECGDNFELSSLRRDDYKLVEDECKEFVDVLQCNNTASSRTPRGHQLPVAFMAKVSGLDDHQVSSSNPLKYTHFDIAGSSGHIPYPATGAPVTALTMHFFA